MKKSIRKPENWQDFEELCKHLWGEIWECKEIKKNGRSGQNQHGVDIYGMPKGETKYFGIQCKGKDEYTKAFLTNKEIDEEIEKAKTFIPPLKKLYFATTANKDERIEEYIRLKNVENIEKGYFEVHLFSWEDIAYLIDQNKRTHDWYIQRINFATNYKVSVLFENDVFVKEFDPILVRNHIKYKLKKDNFQTNPRYYRSPETIKKERDQRYTEAQPVRHFIDGSRRNRGSCVFTVKLKNIGSAQLENLKLYLSFGEECYVAEIVSKSSMFIDTFKYEYNIKWVKGANNLEFKPSDNVLVQNDEAISDKICIRPSIEFPFCLVIPWKLVSKDFTEQGVLKFVFNTEIREKYSEESFSAYFADETILENYTESIKEED